MSGSAAARRDFYETAVSDEARRNTMREDSAPYPDTAVTSPSFARLRALEEASIAAGWMNWDGYGARPVSSGAFAVARAVLNAIPDNWPSPAIGVDPDGEISLEWALGRPDRVLTVSVGETGLLSYAGLYGDSKTHGVEAFVGQLPAAIVANLMRLYSFASRPAAAK